MLKLVAVYISVDEYHTFDTFALWRRTIDIKEVLILYGYSIPNMKYYFIFKIQRAQYSSTH
jgi:hypothetical protein